MSEYYKIAATLPEPEYEGTPPPYHNAGRPTRPHDGKRVSTDSTQEDPRRLSVQNDKPHARNSGHHENDQLIPVGVSPTLRERCQACDGKLRRLLPLVLLVAYTVLGGIVFHLVETYAQSEYHIAKANRALIEKPAAVQLELRMTEIVLDRNYTRDRRKYEVKEALLWYLRQLNEEEKTRWDFVSAMFYSMTLYTTIGYGDTPPKSSAGQFLTVIYSIIGIPLALAALIELGYLVGYVVSKLWSSVRRGVGSAWRRRQSMKRGIQWKALPITLYSARERREYQEKEDADLLSFPLSGLIMLTIFWLLFASLLFYAWEKPWSYGESFYFAFISFTTIGLGDYVPATASGKLGGIFFLLVGLSLFSTTFAVLQQQFDALKNSFQRTIDQEYQKSQSDTGPPMAVGEKAADENLKRMAKQLPLGTRLLYKMLPESKKNTLKEYYDQKSSLVPKSMQTDDYLWAMTQMSRSYLKKAMEDQAGGYKIEGDDAKSRDDVNSLVALCDYTLPYGDYLEN